MVPTDELCTYCQVNKVNTTMEPSTHCGQGVLLPLNIVTAGKHCGTHQLTVYMYLTAKCLCRVTECEGEKRQHKVAVGKKVCFPSGKLNLPFWGQRSDVLTTEPQTSASFSFIKIHTNLQQYNSILIWPHLELLSRVRVHWLSIQVF